MVVQEVGVGNSLSRGARAIASSNGDGYLKGAQRDRFELEMRVVDLLEHNVPSLTAREGRLYSVISSFNLNGGSTSDAMRDFGRVSLEISATSKEIERTISWAMKNMFGFFNIEQQKWSVDLLVAFVDVGVLSPAAAKRLMLNNLVDLVKDGIRDDRLILTVAKGTAYAIQNGVLSEEDLKQLRLGRQSAQE